MQGREGKASGFCLLVPPHPGDLLPQRRPCLHPHTSYPARAGPALTPPNWTICGPRGGWTEACSPSSSPESQVKVRAESSVNMMATACLLVSLGSRVTHLTLLISVTWDSTHRGLSQLERLPLHPPPRCVTPRRGLSDLGPRQILTAYKTRGARAQTP